MIQSIWYDAIHEEYSSDTETFVRNSYGNYHDFNTALGLYCETEEYMTACEEVSAARLDIARLMKSLDNPPAEYEDAHELIEAINEDYIDFIALVEPSGSYTSYSDDILTVQTNFLENWDKLKIELQLVDEG